MGQDILGMWVYVLGLSVSFCCFFSVSVSFGL